MIEFSGKFRFAYTTSSYEETCAFYRETLELQTAFAWDRSDDDKGTLFIAGEALIELLQKPIKENACIDGLDYRTPQGAFIVIQVSNIEDLYESLHSKNISFKEKLVKQSWGQTSFTITDPNGVFILFIQG